MERKSSSKKEEKKSKLTEKEVEGLLSTIKNSAKGGNVELYKKALDTLVKNGGISKLLSVN